MIFGHSLSESKKTVVSAVVFLLSAVALFVAFDPGIKDAIIVLIGNGFAVVAVFAAPKFSITHLTKMLGQLVGSVQSLLTFFVVINPNVWVVIGSTISLIPVGYAVWKAKNQAPITMEPPPILSPPPPSLLAGEITAEQLAAEAITAQKIATEAVAVQDPPVPPGRPVE